MTLVRRALFQVHLWIGIATGLYLCVVCASGAVLVFRIELQRAAYPELLATRSSGPTVDMARILEALAQEYPAHRVAGVDAPTAARSTYLAYVTHGEELRTVLLDAGSARVLGELPESSLIRTLQDLHFNLLTGRRGRTINGIGALCLLAMCITGSILWWRGRMQRRRGLTVDLTAPWPRMLRELHEVVGIWTLAFLFLWAVTALSLTFPRQFRAVVSAISPLSATAVPSSDVAGATSAPSPSWTSMIASAQQVRPGWHVARIVLPRADNDALQVLFAHKQPTPSGTRTLDLVYVDRYTGRPLAQHSGAKSSFGDAIVAWLRPLHVGDFGGFPVKVAWLLLGFMPALLFATGASAWGARIWRPTGQPANWPDRPE